LIKEYEAGDRIFTSRILRKFESIRIARRNHPCTGAAEVVTALPLRAKHGREYEVQGPRARIPRKGAGWDSLPGE
jgi:hypothetical protein